MSSQIISQAAHLLGLEAMQPLAEPSATTMLLVCIAGMLAGRFLLGDRGRGSD